MSKFLKMFKYNWLRFIHSENNVSDKSRKLQIDINRLKKKNKELQAEIYGAYMQMIMHETGQDRKTTEAKFIDCQNRTGCIYKEYYRYKLYEMTDSQQEAVLLYAINKPLGKKYNVDKSFFKVIQNKAKTNILFDKYVRRPWCVNKMVTAEEFRKIFLDSTRVIYKPLSSTRGNGICAFDVNAHTLKNIYSELRRYPIGIVEEYVVQHPDMLSLNPSSVNTLRVVTFSSNSIPVTADGKYMDIAYTSLRIGGGSSIVDNFHSGGMVANVDLGTGSIVTDAVDDNRNVFTHHPMTGIKFRGFKIPYYREALDMVREAITKNRVQGYLGWDVAITKDGPVLIEINTDPGVVLLTSPYIPERKGMKHILLKYL